jgi:ribosome recycling factor
MAVMAREAWTDERLDDLQKHMDEGFREVKAEIRSLRSEVKGDVQSLRTELKGEISKLDAKLGRVNYTLIAALIGLVTTHYLG